MKRPMGKRSIVRVGVNNVVSSMVAVDERVCLSRVREDIS